MAEYQHFTSLTPDQEATFIVYEQRSAEALKSGSQLGWILGVALGVITLLIALTVTPAADPHAAPTSGSTTQKAEAESK